MRCQSPQHSIPNYIHISFIDDYSSEVEQQSRYDVIILKTKILQMGIIAVCLDNDNNMFFLNQTFNKVK